MKNFAVKQAFTFFLLTGRLSSFWKAKKELFCNPKKIVPLLYTAVFTATVQPSFIPLLIKLYLNYEKAHLVKVPLLATYCIYVNSWIQTKSSTLSYGSPNLPDNRTKSALTTFLRHIVADFWHCFVEGRGFWIFHAFFEI